MSRWERVNCYSLAAILVALLLLAGHSLPRTSASAQPEQPMPVAAVASEQQPTESEQEPSGVRGLTVGELLQDAWDSYDTLPPMQPSGQYTMIANYAASYDGQPATYSGSYFSMQSINFPGVFHVFGMQATQRA